jgi:hypothetical protein
MRSALFAGTVAVVVAGASFPLQALAQGSIDERRACTPDAVRLCREFIPDPGKIAACLTARKAELSDLCRPFVLAPAKPAVANAAAEGEQEKKDHATKNKKVVHKTVRPGVPKVIRISRITRVTFLRTGRPVKFEARSGKKRAKKIIAM